MTIEFETKNTKMTNNNVSEMDKTNEVIENEQLASKDSFKKEKKKNKKKNKKKKNKFSYKDFIKQAKKPKKTPKEYIRKTNGNGAYDKIAYI